MDLTKNLIIEASAGSGKTYQLAKRFINIFSKYPSELSSIVAITFTNKASSEMKERIILFLKILAKIYKNKKIKEEDFNIKRENALKLLINIIKNHSDFNVTTIDSFMNRILKALSVDLNILPDYEVNFDTDEIFEMAINELLNNSNNHNDFINLLKSLLTLEQHGFNGEIIIKKYLKNYRNEEIPDNIATLKDFLDKSISYSDFQDYIKEEISTFAESLNSLIDKNSNIFNGNRIRSFKNLNLDKIHRNLPKIREIIINENISIYLKKSKQLDSEDENKFLNILKQIYNLFEKYTIIKAIFKSSIVLTPLKKLTNLENDIKSKLNIVDWAKTNKIISKIIEEKGVNYTYCKIGEYINHYLIDEFQDTSLEQFSAIKPLIENAISKPSGTIFVVGDRKQAIYGWRGGDYKVFDKLKTILEKFKYEIKEINNNYRSYKNIVEFNNRVFSFENLINNLPEVDYIEELNEDLKIFKNSSQGIVNNKNGYVNVILKNENDIEDKDEFYENSFNSIIHKVLNENKIQPKDIMILLRKKENIEKIVSWLREKYPDINFITEDSLSLLSNFEVKKLLLIILAIIKDYDKTYLKSLEETGIKILNKDDLKFQAKRLSPYEFICYLIEKNYVNYISSKAYFDVLLEKVLELGKDKFSLEDIVDYFYNNREISIKIPEGINAVKILTIHKAKGLEAHTVIIPFYDWEIGSKNIDDFITVEYKDKNIFAKIKDLKDIDENIRKIYNMKRAMNFIEDLNLMYVANTRAIANLFIIGTYKDKKNPKIYNAGTFLWKLIDKEYYENGEIEREEEFTDIYSEKANPLKVKSNIRKFLKTYKEIEEYNIFDENRKTGELFHLAMSFIGIIKYNDFEKNIKDAYIKATKIMKYENKNVINFMKNCIVDLKEYFTSIDEYWNEKEIIDENGNIYRIDRLVKKEDKFTIIDYKTGENIEEKHKSQINNYLKLFINSKGILYYAKTRKLFLI